MESPYHSAIKHALKTLTYLNDSEFFKYEKSLSLSASLKILSDSYKWEDDLKLVHTDHDSFERLKRYCSWLIRRGDPLPDDLKSWIANYLDEVFVPPLRRKGAPRTGAEVSNYLGQLVKEVTTHFKLSPTRNDTSAKLSACDAVSEAINTFNKNLEPKDRITPGSYSSLKKKYFTYLSHF